MGSCSFAAGSGAKANHVNCFVWGDTASTGGGQFVVGSGNIWFGSGSPNFPLYTFINTSTGAYLNDFGVWIDSSDAAKKENFAPVDVKEVLERVANLPITRWNYKGEPPSPRHIGPTAQDFYAAFGLGADDKHIASLDTGGVALGAIQGLYEIVKEKDARIASQESQITALNKKNVKLEARLAAMEATVAKLAGTRNGGAR